MNEIKQFRLLIHFRNGRVRPVLMSVPVTQPEAYQSALKEFSALPGLRYIEVQSDFPPASSSQVLPK